MGSYKRPAGVPINPEVVRAMAVGWDYQLVDPMELQVVRDEQ